MRASRPRGPVAAGVSGVAAGVEEPPEVPPASAGGLSAAGAAPVDSEVTVVLPSALTLGASAGSNGFLRSPSTRRRGCASPPAAASSTTGSAIVAPVATPLSAAGAAGATGSRVLGEDERDRCECGHQQDRHRQQAALEEAAPDVLDGLHRVAPVTVAVVVVAVVPPAGAGVAAGVAAAGPCGVAPAVRPCVSGTR